MAWMGAAGARAMPNMIYNVNPFKYADLKDRVAGNTLSVLRSGSLVAEQKDGTFKSFAANTPAIGAWGVMSDGAGTNYCTESYDASQWNFSVNCLVDTSLSVLDLGANVKLTTMSTTSAWGAIYNYLSYATCTIADNGYHAVSFQYKAGDAVECFIKIRDTTNSLENTIVFAISAGVISFSSAIQDNSAVWAHISTTISDKGDGVYFIEIINRNISGGNIDVQLHSFYPASSATEAHAGWVGCWQSEVSQFATSYIPTRGAAASRATQAGSTTNGLYIVNADLDSRVIPSLSAEGTSIMGLRFEYPENTAVNKGVLTFSNQAHITLRQGNNDDVRLADGTNNITNSNGWARGITAFITTRHKASTVSMGLYVSNDNGATWATNNGTFDGTFPYNDTLRYFYGNGYQSWMLFHQMYDGELTDAEIEAAVADAMEPLSGANLGLIRPLISDLISDIIRPIIG